MPPPSTVDCIIPAAGAARRMGRGKLLLPFRGATVLDATVANARAAGCRVVLVTGCRAVEIEALFRPAEDLRIERNPDWERGMLGSIQAGLRCLAAWPGSPAPGFLIMPGDLPLVGPAVYRRMIEASAECRTAGLPDLPLVPRCGGRRGHPVYMPAALVPAILGLPPDGRLRDFLDGAGALAMDVDDPAICADIDEPADYRRLAGQGQ